MENKFISACDYAKTGTDSLAICKNWSVFTTTLLHAPREIDKTARALDMTLTAVNQGRKVLFVDTQNRLSAYKSRLIGVKNLYIYHPSYESPDDPTDYADLVISGIQEAVANTNIRTFVIDSLTRIAALSFGRNASPAYVMKRLVALQVRCGLTLLVISHDSTKTSDEAISGLADNEISMCETVDELKKEPAAPAPRSKSQFHDEEREKQSTHSTDDVIIDSSGNIRSASQFWIR